MSNPFIGFGTPVNGERLVGREKELQWLNARLESSSANISIIGQRRIGKTSLALSAKMAYEKKSVQKGVFLLYIDLSSLPTIGDFFKLVYEFCYESLSLTNSLDEDLTDYELYRNCRKSLLKAFREDIRVKLILDEFDSITNYEKPKFAIQWIRELLDKNYETGLSAIFLSRRSIYHIESQIADISTLDGICEKYFLKTLNKNYCGILLNKYPQHFNFNEKQKDNIIWHTGGHPYFLEMILCRTLDHSDLEVGLTLSFSDIFNHYEYLRKALEKEKLFNDLLQVTVGPQWNLTFSNLNTLVNYGYLNTGSDASNYKTWSPHFHTYLESISRSIPVWPLWSKVEATLRGLSQKRIQANDIVIEGSAFEKIYRSCVSRMQKDIISKKIDYQNQWLDYTYPNEIWQLITIFWDQFENDLNREGNKNKQYWNQRFQLFSKARTPLAHNRANSLTKNEVALFKIYCEELLSVLA